MVYFQYLPVIFQSRQEDFEFYPNAVEDLFHWVKTTDFGLGLARSQLVLSKIVNPITSNSVMAALIAVCVRIRLIEESVLQFKDGEWLCLHN